MYELVMEAELKWDDAVLLEAADQESLVPAHIIRALTRCLLEIPKLCPVEPAICSCAKYNRTNAVESAGGRCGMRWKVYFREYSFLHIKLKSWVTLQRSLRCNLCSCSRVTLQRSRHGDLCT
jgi:hypothetical protein